MTENFDSTEWVTTAEAAELTGYSVQYVRRLIKKQRVSARKWARDWLVDKTALLAYQEQMGQLGTDKYNPWRTGARQHKEEGVG